MNPSRVVKDTMIRRATSEDAAAIAALVRLAFSTQSRPTVPPSGALRETAQTISDHRSRGSGAVAEEHGTLVGAVLWSEEDRGLYVGRLSVHPEHRRRGIARALMAEAEREARRLGLSHMHLGVRLTL